VLEATLTEQVMTRRMVEAHPLGRPVHENVYVPSPPEGMAEMVIKEPDSTL